MKQKKCGRGTQSLHGLFVTTIYNKNEAKSHK
jgi:hypothetical protein